MTSPALAHAAATARRSPGARHSGVVRTGLWIFLAVAAGLVAATVASDVRTSRRLERDARAASWQQALDGAAYIERELEGVVPIADAIARDLGSGTLAATDLSTRLTADLARSVSASMVGVAYSPYAHDAKLKLYAPHAVRTNGHADLFQLERRYDYTTYDWFTDGLRGARWDEPYFSEATNRLEVAYIVPFSRPHDSSRTPIGVARVTFSLDGIHELVSRVSLGQTGYGFLLSRRGTYLSYPDVEYVRQQRNALDLARARRDPVRLGIFERGLRGEATEDMSRSDQTGRLVWLVQQPVKTTGWVFGIDYFADEVMLDARAARRGLARISGSVLLLLFAVSLLTFHVERGAHRDLWASAIALGVLLLAAISSLWWLTTSYPDRNGEASVHILDETSLEKFLGSQIARARGAVEPARIPTGVLVRTVRFVDANDVVITGTAWQRIPAALRASISPGFEMPDAEVFELRDASTERRADADLASWSFKATLREPSEWSRKYPFDRALMRLRMIAKPAAVPVVLTPDFSAYELLMPDALPGVDRSAILSGWDVDHSYYSYIAQSTRVTESAPSNLARVLPYDFSFNIVAERRFLDPFVSSVLPIIVIACLLFGLLIVGSKNSQKVSATGFKATDVLRASVTLLFPALVAQVNLRSKIGANEIIYIEYFYFILYVAILGVSANALAFTLGVSGVSQVRDNLVPKLLYWPAFLGACCAVTIAFLY
jgi:hypothetical protein